MNTIKYELWGKIEYLIFLAILLGVLYFISIDSSAANVSMNSHDHQGHIIDNEPEYFYLFNNTNRRYEDIIQFEVDKSKCFIWVKMRAKNLTVIKYLFTDKDWARIYVNDTLTVVSAVNMTVSNSSKVKFTLDKWTLRDDGESITIYQVIKSKEESINETWTFYYKLGKPPKITWYIEDLDDKKQENRTLDWKIKIQSSYFILKSKTKDNATTTKFKVKDLEIDWADFGTSNVQVESNNTTKEYIITFYPEGKAGNYIIDPIVSFTTTAMTSVSWVYLALVNPQNPTDPTEPTRYDYIHFVWYDSAAPTVEIPVDSNPFPLPNSITAYVKVYDNWGRFWLVPSFGTGGPGTYTRIDGELPICWISVQCWNGIRNDGFHRWAIRPVGGGTWFYVDEPVKFPVVVDDNNQIDWEVFVPEDSWISEAGIKTVTHAELAGRREFVLNFDVILKTEPVTVHIRYYDGTTGEGIPWETYKSTWDDAVMGTNVIQTMSSESHTLIVLDYFDNILYTDTVTGNNWDLPIHIWAADITAYSVRFFNQEYEYVHKIGLQYNKAGSPYEFYIAPLEVVEIFLKAAEYRIAWTPYKWYMAQDTQYFDLTISEANYFLINGTIIANITMDTSGLYALEQVITTWMMPGILYVPTDLPHAPCGEDLGIVYLHPYTIVTAEISYNYTGTSALLWTPHPDRIGRNYTIDRDRLYFSGTYNTRVYINWSSNSTTRFNLTSLPASLDLGDGGNYTIWTNNSIDFTRETTFREYTLFYWSYTISEHKYIVSQPINNTMNLTMRRVNVLIGWPENRNIDLTGVSVYDINNAMLLTSGEHYDATIGGVYLYFEDLLPGTIRTFTIKGWDYNTTGLWDIPVITMAGEDRKSHGGENYYHLVGSWTNSYSVAYSGSLYISIKIKGVIDPSSLIVFDEGASTDLSEDSYSVMGNTIIIHGIGPVPVGSTLKYEVFYDKSTDDEGFSIFGPLIGPLSLWWIGLIITMVGGYLGSFRIHGTHNKELYWISILIIICVFMISGMMNYTGVII